MSSPRQHSYYFASEQQWSVCFFSGADRANREGKFTIRPFAPLSPQLKPAHPTQDAFAPACTRAGEVLWRDSAGRLYRLSHAGEKPYEIAAPATIARAWRIVASGSSLWVKGHAAHTIECFDVETLSRRIVVEVSATDVISNANASGLATASANVIDIAADGHDGVYALIAAGDAWHVVHVDCAGTIGKDAPLRGIPAPREFTYVRGADRIVVLSRDGAHVYGFSKAGGDPDFHVLAASLGDCFMGCHIASHTRGRVFVAGITTLDAPEAHLVTLDTSGVKLSDVALTEPATGLAARRDQLLITGWRGLYVLPTADQVPATVAEVTAMLVTPALEAPDTPDQRRWLRIEAVASLPAGSSLEIVYAATDDAADHAEMLEIARNVEVSEAVRARVLSRFPGLWRKPTAFQGSDRLANQNASFAVPLHDVRERYLWAAVSLAAHADAHLPVLSSLSVLYPGRTLMEHLPAIYQRQEAQPGSFTRDLVGVLETTTQSLDVRIGNLGRYIDPKHAPAQWLDYLARWLGPPWDDALDEKQKRCIIESAARIARARGTRAGLEALLDCLMDGTPRPFRVIDTTADHGLARVGGGECKGAALPAILGGLPATAARLDVQAALGSMRLPCPDESEDDGMSRFLGAIRVDVAASAQNRTKWEPWFTRLIAEMVPAGTRACVRWTTASALRGDRLDESLTLEAEHPPYLGTDAIMGVARLPRAGSTLPASSTGDGPILE